MTEANISWKYRLNQCLLRFFNRRVNQIIEKKS